MTSKRATKRRRADQAVQRASAPVTAPPEPVASVTEMRAGPRLVLHVGCGPYHVESLHPRYRGLGWREVRLDIDPDVKPDIVASIVDMSPVESESMDAVWSSHNLEHVYSHEVASVLESFYRVLRPGGEALITMPDLQSIALLISRGRLEDTAYVSPAGPIAPLDVVYGHRASVARGNEFMAHRTGFTAKTLREKLRTAGFVDVKVERKAHEFALWATARRPATGAAGPAVS
jgi:SAM-dependent methyltransferase